jgi:hypothetical protein
LTPLVIASDAAACRRPCGVSPSSPVARTARSKTVCRKFCRRSRPDPEVVFRRLPTTRLGAVARRRLGSIRRRGRRAHRGVPAERVRPPRRDEWSALLRELAQHLDAGRIYARDLPGLAPPSPQGQAALHRHHANRRLHRS